MGDKVIIANPLAWNPFLNATEVEVTSRDSARVSLDGGYGNRGEPVTRVRNKAGKGCRNAIRGREASARSGGRGGDARALSIDRARKKELWVGRRSRVASTPRPTLPGRPLLVIDGDSFAHRSYHALPKTIRRSDGKSAGAILGFANFLLRLYMDERPRAVIVGWDTLEMPTRRHEMFPAYQSGREFAEDLIEQLSSLPEFVAACWFVNAKAPGFEADDFLAAAVAAEERAGGSAVVASGDRDSFQLASQRTAILYPSRGGEIARIGPEEVRQRYGVDPKQVPDFIALRGDPSDKLGDYLDDKRGTRCSMRWTGRRKGFAC
jgi:5'-3' exonuclease, N-terminal resolvase-like domain